MNIRLPWKIRLPWLHKKKYERCAKCGNLLPRSNKGKLCPKCRRDKADSIKGALLTVFGALGVVVIGIVKSGKNPFGNDSKRI